MPLKRLLVFGALCMTLLSGCRMGQFVYITSRYDRSFRNTLPRDAVELEYRAAAGRQFAFYIPPRRDPGRAPERLWMLFGGNAAVALGWLELVREAPDPRAGFLMVDYPGYGACEGYPSQATIKDSMDKALDALAARLGVAPAALERHLALLGHSLGCATALQFAAHHRVERLVLLAPFTTMVEIAQHMVGWPFCELVPDRYDNIARLDELHARKPRPAVTIIHGDRDSIVPAQMGRSLAGRYPDWIQYIEIPGATHRSLLNGDRRSVLRAMTPNPNNPPGLVGLH